MARIRNGETANIQARFIKAERKSRKVEKSNHVPDDVHQALI